MSSRASIIPLSRTDSSGKILIERCTVTVVLLMLAIGLTACASTIIPPLEVSDPQPVAVLDHGRHASLVLSTDRGTMIRYSYGDWAWYALMKTNVFRGAAALFWPTQAGMGRRELEGPVSVENIRRRVRVGSEEIFVIIVERSRVDALREELDSLFHDQIDTRIYNSAYDLEFVHHPKRYCAFHNSNQVVAGWLKKLGCRVSGLAVFSDWKLKSP
jgi:hypothetical protein